jgi:hypothetical protein
MADLKLTISEEINLPNNNVEKVVNRKTISGVNQITRRLDTITTSFSGTGIELLRFVDNESSQVAGSFVRDAVKYIRITNIDSTNFCTIYLIKTDQESVLFKLDAGKSLMFSNAEFNASEGGDYVVESYVDETYYSDFTTIDVIKAKADTANVQLDYFVASS